MLYDTAKAATAGLLVCGAIGLAAIPVALLFVRGAVPAPAAGPALALTD